jgi:hypothetical protein
MGIVVFMIGRDYREWRQFCQEFNLKKSKKALDSRITA